MFRVIFSLLLINIIVNNTYGQTDKISYLEKNSYSVDINCNGDETSFSFLDSIVPNFKFFFTGEFHFAPDNPCIKFSFIKYLNRNANLRYVVHEFGSSTSYLMNQYFESADLNIKSRIIALFNTEKSYVNTVFKLNNSLPINQKIKFIGIDADYNYHNVFALIHLLDKPNQPNEIHAILEKLKMIKHDTIKVHNNKVLIKYDTKQWDKVQSDIKSHIDENEQLYKTFLEQDFYYLETIINTPTRGPTGELFKYNNLIKAYNNFKDGGNFYANYGDFHTNLNLTFRNIFPTRTFAGMLKYKKNSPFNNKVLVFGMAYSNPSDFMPSSKKRKSNHSYKITKDDFQLLDEIAKTKFTIFDYQDSGKLFKKIRNRCNYILYIKNN